MDISIEHDAPVRKPSRLLNWKPKAWRPKYVNIVVAVAAGKSYKWISEHVEPHYTPQHISNIMQLDEALDLQHRLVTRMEETAQVSISDRLDRIAEKALARTEQVLNSDELFEKSPFNVIDRGLEVLKGLGHLRGGGNGSMPAGQTNNFFGSMPVELQNQLLEGTKAADKARQLQLKGEDVTDVGK